MIRVRGVGSLYWGLEVAPVVDLPERTEDGDLEWSEVRFPLGDQRRFCGGWVQEDTPPYRATRPFRGFRIRLSKVRAFHFGLCDTADDVPDTLKYHLIPDAKPWEINDWGMDVREDDETEGTEGEEEGEDHSSSLSGPVPEPGQR